VALFVGTNKKAIGFILKLAFEIFRPFHGTQPIPSWARTQGKSSRYCKHSCPNRASTTPQSGLTPH